MLVALGPMQARPPNADPRGGRDMCSNSYTLAKALGDLPTQIAAVDAVLQCPRQPLTPNPNPAPCMAAGRALLSGCLCWRQKLAGRRLPPLWMLKRAAGCRDDGALAASPQNEKRVAVKEAELQRRILAATQGPHHSAVLAL